MDQKPLIRLIVSRGETKGKVFILEQGENLIGRWDADQGTFPEVDLEAHDPEAKVSRGHAILHVNGTAVEIEDIGSMNGTFVNRGERLAVNKRVALSANDELIIGKTFLQLEIKPEAN